MWLADCFLPLAIALGVAAVALAVWAVVAERVKFLAVAGVCLLLGVGAFVADRLIVTESEKVDALVTELAAAVVAGNVENAMSFLSPNADAPRDRIAFGMNYATIDDDLRISDLATAVTANDTQAVSDFRANGTIRSKLGGISAYTPTKWQLVWRKEAGEWKIVQIRRFDPITGEPFNDILAPR